MHYIVLNEQSIERVTPQDIDPAELAGVIDRTVIPVQNGQTGHAFSRRLGYTVTGSIGGKRARLTLFDENALIAELSVCAHSRSSPSLWREAHGPMALISDAPPPPWCALRYVVAEVALPEWLDWWAKTTGWAIVDAD